MAVASAEVASDTVVATRDSLWKSGSHQVKQKKRLRFELAPVQDPNLSDSNWSMVD